MREVFFAVLVVPNGLVREGLARILGAARFRVLGSAASLDESILSMPLQHQSVLLVIGLSEDPDATARQIELFKERHPDGRVAVLAEHYELGHVVSAFRAGANAYLVKVSNCDAFIKSLESVMLGATIMPSEVLSSIVERDDETITREMRVQAEALTEAETDDVPRLSLQEKRILRHLVEGDSNKVIARKIDIAEATVKVHIKAILRKIRVHNRTQAAIWALGKGSFGLPIENATYDTAGKGELPCLYNGHGSVPLMKS
jgi:two-component system nitrate/nitrite response regulator NarL